MFIGHEGNHFVISGNPTNIEAQIVFAMCRCPVVKDIIKTCATRFDELNEEFGDGVRNVTMDHLIEINSGNYCQIMEIFKKASKKKLRFNTNRGVLSVEQLWDLPKEEIRQLVIKSREVVKKTSGEVNDSELSFLDAPVKAKATDDELRFEILKDIYITKRSAEEKAQKKAEARANNKKILELIARKQDEALEKKSIKDLEKMLEPEVEDDED